MMLYNQKQASAAQNVAAETHFYRKRLGLSTLQLNLH